MLILNNSSFNVFFGQNCFIKNESEKILSLLQFRAINYTSTMVVRGMGKWLLGENIHIEHLIFRLASFC